MGKIKKIISNIGEIPISINNNGIKYYLNGIAYKYDKNNSGDYSGSTDFIEFDEDSNFLYLIFSKTVIEDETEDTITINKEISIGIKYSKENKNISVIGEGFTTGIDKFINFKKIQIMDDYSRNNLKKFTFSILKNEPFYENLIENIVIENINKFCMSIIKLYLTDNICILSFLSKFNLFDSLNSLLFNKEEKILCKLKESQETIIYKLCELF